MTQDYLAVLILEVAQHQGAAVDVGAFNLCSGLRVAAVGHSRDEADHHSVGISRRFAKASGPANLQIGLPFGFGRLQPARVVAVSALTGPPAVDDLVDPSWRDADGFGQPVLAEPQGLEELFEQHLAGMDGGEFGGRYQVSSVVVDDLYLVCVPAVQRKQMRH